MKSTKRRAGRTERTARKHQEIRALFEKDYINQKRVNGAKIYTSAYIIAQLSERFYLSMRQIENIVYSKPKTDVVPTDEPAPTPLQAAA